MTEAGAEDLRIRNSLLVLRAVLVLVLCAWLLAPAAAHADGDPGSDVLVAQNLFSGELELSARQQLQLGAILGATAKLGAPVRVAIISKRTDLGSVTGAWRKPQLYANFLALELKFDYPDRLLIVMPNGFGVAWTADEAAGSKLAGQLDGYHPSSDTPAGYALATTSAVERIEEAAGISAAKLMRTAAAMNTGGTNALAATAPPASPSTSGSAPRPRARPAQGSTGPSSLDLLLLVVLAVVVALVLYASLRRSGRVGPIGPKRPAVTGAATSLLRRSARPVMVLPALLLAVVVMAFVINQAGSSGTASANPAANPDLDPGTQVSPVRMAPNFTLSDETGQRVSLSQFRGKAVILAFIDAECQTLCPLTTEAMLDAKRSLGAAAAKVQLLGVNVNWKSTQIDDVLNYTQLHGLGGQWHFLTSSSLPVLEKVWDEYGVNERALIDDDSNDIDHVAAVDLIDPRGQLRTVFTTQSAYAAIPQFGQLLAEDVSKMLPGHPKVDSHYSYAQVKGITPSQHVDLPRAGGGTVALGPGKPRLSLFLATWDTQTMGTIGLAHDLDELNQYNAYASTHRLAKLTAIDEGSVEPSPAALPAFLKTLPAPLSYPVAIDPSGRLADGYEVEGQPWFVLTSASGQILWYQEVYTGGWPSVVQLERDVRAALSKAPRAPTSERVAERDLAGSPAPLAAIHRQASRLLAGGALALYRRIHSLHGYPVVVNIWASDCTPCQKEFGLFATASALYGKKVAFLGADNEDLAGNARAFLRAHQVSYPSYQTQTNDLSVMLSGGLEGTPTTVYIDPQGKVLYVHIGQYLSQGVLDADIEDYAGGNAG